MEIVFDDRLVEGCWMSAGSACLERQREGAVTPERPERMTGKQCSGFIAGMKRVMERKTLRDVENELSDDCSMDFTS